MNRIVTHSKVAADGTVAVTVQLPIKNAGEEVQITVESMKSESLSTQQEWDDWFNSISGKWQGDFEEFNEGPIQEREPFN